MPTNIQSLAITRDDLKDVYNSSPRETPFLAQTILPPLPKRKRKGEYLVVQREAHLARRNTKRARDAETSTSQYGLDEATFKLIEYSHKHFVNRKDAEDIDDLLNLEEEGVLHCRAAIDIDFEIDVATDVFSETRFTPSGNTGVTLSNEWDDATLGTPVSDIALGMYKFANQHGAMANALIITWHTWTMGLSRSDEVRAALTDMYGRVKDNFIPLDMLAGVLSVPRIIVAMPDLVYNSAAPNAAASYTPIWNEEYALLTRIAPPGSRNLNGPYLGRTHELDEGRSLMIESWEQNDPKGTWVRAERNQEAHFFADAPGYLIKNVKS
jgi:hypothetical protein